MQAGPRKSSPPPVLHVSLATVLISVFTLFYGPGLLFRGLESGPRQSNPGP